MPWELKVGLKYLFAKRREKFISIISFLSIGGVAISVMTLVVVSSVMSGFDRDLKKKILGTHAHFNITSNTIIEDIPEVTKEVKRCEEVLASSPFIFGQVMLEVRKKVYGVLLRGIDVEREVKVSEVGNYLSQGRLPSADNEIVIGRELAKNLRLRINDTVKILSSAPETAALGLSPSLFKFKVVGIFNSGMYQYDASLVYTTLEPAQMIFGLGEGVHGVGLKIKDIDKTIEVKENLIKIFRYPYKVKSWIDMNRNLFAALKTEKNVMFILLFLAILVSATNIISTLVMIVMEKTKDIGVLRSLGAGSKSILQIFIYKGFIIGILGTFLGLLSGLLFVYWLEPVRQVIAMLTGFEVFPKEIYYFDKIPTYLTLRDTMIIAVGAILISTLAALYPAYKAAKLNPVEALRYE